MCSFPDCNKPAKKNGLCYGHISQITRGSELKPLKSRIIPESDVCSFEGCGAKHNARGLCTGHYKQFMEGKELTPLKPKNKNPVECSFPGCDKRAVALTLCIGHWDQQARGAGLTPLRKSTGRRIDRDGYVVITIKPGVYKYEHRIVMEDIIGRELVAKENVHHINGDRADNRPENLELWNTSQPPGQRVEDKVQHAITMLELYRPDLLRSENGGKVTYIINQNASED